MGVTNYLWNDINDTVLMEKDGNGDTTAVYQSDPVPYGRLRSMRRDGTTYNYHYDGRGNTTYLTNQTGKKTDTYSYGPFGTQRTHTGSTENPYRFGGQFGYQYNPATDDYYGRESIYQPKSGRWESLPFVFAAIEVSYSESAFFGNNQAQGKKAQSKLPQWTQKLVSKPKMDGKLGYKVLVRQILGAKNTGITAAKGTQSWQVNAIKTLFVRWTGEKCTQTETTVHILDVNNIGGKPTPIKFTDDVKGGAVITPKAKKGGQPKKRV